MASAEDVQSQTYHVLRGGRPCSFVWARAGRDVYRLCLLKNAVAESEDVFTFGYWVFLTSAQSPKHKLL